MERCPLCAAAPRPFFKEAGRGWEYLECPGCGLAFKTERQRLALARQKPHYDLHRNDPADEGYRRFLSPVVEALAPRLAPGARGLDYGCGPGPALARLLEERGFAVTLYDPLYADRPAALGESYEFVTCTETAEHFLDPAAEFERLGALLRPRGWLALMTRRRDGVDFASWGYRQDETHVCFYAESTMRWIARRRGWELELPSRELALFRRR